MKYLYVIALNNVKGLMQSFGIVASKRETAEAEACRLAGVPVGTEPHTFQRLHVVDSVVD